MSSVAQALFPLQITSCLVTAVGMSPKLAIAVKSLQSCSAIVHFVAASSLASSMDSGTSKNDSTAARPSHWHRRQATGQYGSGDAATGATCTPQQDITLESYVSTLQCDITNSTLITHIGRFEIRTASFTMPNDYFMDDSMY
ncbi:hypothetical protein NA56DRAFT_712355 [Hyaloscypha hepaticicola]|uniref:Uncharacterized protein n=1 Tax=Hyaloscypha hepaticicola TaxID=2082293 RepID=A0A2J6PGL5_9HELO|nr:hypothetical protein NA56DRAFT_712355 [Hyaloscypha hepaticicola]